MKSAQIFSWAIAVSIAVAYCIIFLFAHTYPSGWRKYKIGMTYMEMLALAKNNDDCIEENPEKGCLVIYKNEYSLFGTIWLDINISVKHEGVTHVWRCYRNNEVGLWNHE